MKIDIDDNDYKLSLEPEELNEVTQIEALIRFMEKTEALHTVTTNVVGNKRLTIPLSFTL